MSQNKQPSSAGGFAVLIIGIAIFQCMTYSNNLPKVETREAKADAPAVVLTNKWVEPKSVKVKYVNPNDYIGKSIHTAEIGVKAGQDNNWLDCVDNFNVDLFNRTGIKPKIKVGSAKQIWANPELEIDDSIEYEKIPNTSEFIAQEGDYALWENYPESEKQEWKSKANGKTISGWSPHGHIAIVLAGTDANVLKVVEQDSSKNIPSYYAERSYNNLAGVIRLKKN
jgi:hypothetical protein